MKQGMIVLVLLIFLAATPSLAQTPEGQTADPQAVPAAPAQTSDEKAAPADNAPAASGQAQEDKLPWWPTDARPAPVRDEERGGFWWWPTAPGSVKELWGNRGFAYVNKIIYDWQGVGKGGTFKDVQVRINDIAFPETEQKPSLLVKRTVRSQMIQFKDSNIEITAEHAALLKKAAGSLKRNKEASVLIAAHNDTPELGSARTQAAKTFLAGQGVAPERIYVLTPEKLQEAGLAPKQPPGPGEVQVLIAELKEVLIPGPKE